MAFTPPETDTMVTEPGNSTRKGKWSPPHQDVEGRINDFVEDESFDPVEHYRKGGDLQTAVQVLKRRQDQPTNFGKAAIDFTKGAVKSAPRAVFDFARGVANLGGNAIDAIAGDSAEQQRAARESLAAVELGAKQGFVDRAVGIGRNVRKLFGRKLSDQELEDQILWDAASRHVNDEISKGHLGTANNVGMSPEELAKAGKPIDPERVNRMSFVGDPMTYLIEPAAKAIGPTLGKAVTAPLLGTAGKVVGGVGRIAETASSIPSSLVKGVFVHNPIAAIPGVSANLASKHLLSGVASALTEAGAEAAGAAAPLGQSLARKAFKSGAQGAVTGAALSLPYMASAQSTEEAGAALGGGIGLGGVLGGLQGVKNARRIEVGAKAGQLANEGAQIRYGTGFDEAHEAAMKTVDPATRKIINMYRARFNGMTDKNGVAIQIYLQTGPEFAKNGGADSRGFITPDGTQIFLNADAANTPDRAGETLGHEAGGHLTEYLAELSQQHDLATLRDTLKDSLYTNGKPTPRFQAFIDSYKQDAIKSGITPEEIEAKEKLDPRYFEKEFFAQHAAKILSGEDIANFHLPKPISERLIRGASDWLRSQGIFKKEGGDIGWNGREIKQITGQLRDLLYKQGEQSEALRSARLKGEPAPDVQGKRTRFPENPTLVEQPTQPTATPVNQDQLDAAQNGRFPSNPTLSTPITPAPGFPANPADVDAASQGRFPSTFKVAEQNVPPADIPKTFGVDQPPGAGVPAKEDLAIRMAKSDAMAALKSTSLRGVVPPDQHQARLDAAVKAAQDAGIPITADTLLTYATTGKLPEPMASRQSEQTPKSQPSTTETASFEQSNPATFSNQVKNLWNTSKSGWFGKQFGTGKLLINHAYEQWKKDSGSNASLDEFKQQLLQGARDGKIELSRADFATGVDVNDLRNSTIKHFGEDYQYINLKEPKPEKTNAPQAKEETREAKHPTTGPKTTPVAPSSEGLNIRVTPQDLAPFGPEETRPALQDRVDRSFDPKTKTVGPKIMGGVRGTRINRNNPSDADHLARALENTPDPEKADSIVKQVEDAIANNKTVDITYNSAKSESKETPTNVERTKEQSLADVGLLDRKGVQKDFAPQYIEIYDTDIPHYDEASVEQAKQRIDDIFSDPKKRRWNGYTNAEKAKQDVEEFAKQNREGGKAEGFSKLQASGLTEVLKSPETHLYLRGDSPDKTIANAKNLVAALEPHTGDKAISNAVNYLKGNLWQGDLIKRRENMANGYRADGKPFMLGEGDPQTSNPDFKPHRLPDFKVQVLNLLEGGPTNTYFEEAQANLPSVEGDAESPRPSPEALPDTGSNPLVNKLKALGKELTLKKEGGEEVSGLNNILAQSIESIRLDRIKDLKGNAPLEIKPSDYKQRAAGFMPDTSMKSDMQQQSEWMEREARARGYDGLSHLLDEKPEEMRKMAAQWRVYHARDKKGTFLQDKAVSAINKALYGRQAADQDNPDTQASRGNAGESSALGDAAAFTEGNAGSGEEAGRGQPEAQRDALISWARDNGVLLDKWPRRLNTSRSVGGNEHEVWPDSGRWIKSTKGTGRTMGYVPEATDSGWSLRPATPSEYLAQKQAWNNLFGDDIRLHAVVQDKHGNVNVLTSQPDITGESVSQQDIADAMNKAGFKELGNDAFYREDDNVLVFDLHDKNAVKVGGVLIPFDGGVIHPEYSLIEAMRNASSKGVMVSR
jgi:hypothetical protein